MLHKVYGFFSMLLFIASAIVGCYAICYYGTLWAYTVVVKLIDKKKDK